MKEKDIAGKMIRTNIIHRRITEKLLESTGVYQGQHRILMELAKHEYYSQKEIAVAMKVSTATIAIALKKLEKNGYISKVTDEADNRLNKIHITAKGQQVVDDSVKIFERIDKKAFEGFSEEEKSGFYSMLDRLEINMAELEEELRRARK